MMTLKIQIIIAVMVLVFVGILFVMTLKKFIQPKYTLAWFLVSVGILILDIFPGLMTALSNAIGIFSPVNMVFFVGFLYMGFVIFALSVALSRMSGRVTRLTQEMALLRKEIEDRGREDK